MPDQSKENSSGVDGGQAADGVKFHKFGDSLIGKTLFNQYEVLEVLGESSMSLVLKARDILSDRLVAIKTVIPTESEVVQRFAQEVQLHRRLKHKNIVEAVDCLATSTGRIFFVMEFLSGTSLHKVLQSMQRIRDEENLASIVIQICDALSHAHENSVLHRDLKPGNIFLSEEGGQYYVKVLDFGIAKPLGQPTGLTHAGYAVGSPLYMSPEQCRGQPADARSDVYSLGVLTYEMATGELPYPGHNVMTVMAAHCDPDRKPPHLARHVPRLRRVDHLNAIIQTAMETETAKRFQTIDDYKKAIELWYEAIGSDNHAAQSSRSQSRELSVVISEPSQPAAIINGVESEGSAADSTGNIGSDTIAPAIEPALPGPLSDLASDMIETKPALFEPPGPEESPVANVAVPPAAPPQSIESPAQALASLAAAAESAQKSNYPISPALAPGSSEMLATKSASSADLVITGENLPSPGRSTAGKVNYKLPDGNSDFLNRISVHNPESSTESRTRAIMVTFVVAIFVLAIALLAMARFLLR